MKRSDSCACGKTFGDVEFVSSDDLLIASHSFLTHLQQCPRVLPSIQRWAVQLLRSTNWSTRIGIKEEVF